MCSHSASASSPFSDRCISSPLGFLFDSPVRETLVTRRRSVDVGGLALALQDRNSGKGWGGWDESENVSFPYAELLVRMYLQTTLPSPPTWPFSSPPSSSRSQLINTIGTWAFDPHSLSEAETFTCVCLIFEVLFMVDGMEEEVQLQPQDLTPFLCAVRSIYDPQNAYHNYQHALDVLQAMYVFLVEAGCIPPISILETVSDDHQPKWRRNLDTPGRTKHILSNTDVFTLFIAAIGHDVGHPGLNNTFMKNASTPLSSMYDHTSTLERMHCTLLLQLMRNSGLGHLINSNPLVTAHPTQEPRDLIRDEPLASSSSAPMIPTPLSRPSAISIRSMLVQTVLATDMSIHARWMNEFSQFADLAEAKMERGASSVEHALASDEIESTRLIICQALLKCADISNPARPHAISKTWSTALLNEWFAQATLERSLSLPVSVPASSPPLDSSQWPGLPLQAHYPSPSSPDSGVSTPSVYALRATRDQVQGQLGFIDMCAGPLFALVSRFAPELELFCIHCNDNRAVWQTSLDGVIAAEKAFHDSPSLPSSSIPEPPLPEPSPPSCPECLAALTANTDAESSHSTPPLLSSGRFTPHCHSISSSMSSLHSGAQLDVLTPKRIQGSVASFHLSEIPKWSIARPPPNSTSSGSSPSSYHSALPSPMDSIRINEGDEGQQDVTVSNSLPVSFPLSPHRTSTTELIVTTSATVPTFGDLWRSSPRRSVARSAKTKFLDEDRRDGWQFAHSVGFTAIRTAYRASARSHVLYGDARFRRRSVGLLSRERSATPSSVH